MKKKIYHFMLNLLKICYNIEQIFRKELIYETNKRNNTKNKKLLCSR